MSVSTLRLLWFFVWRMAVWNSLLGAATGAVCGAGVLISIMAVSASTANAMADDGTALAGGIFYVFGAGVVFGALGAVAGLLLGLLGGLVLFVLTSVFFQPISDDHVVYRRTAGWVCAAVSALASLADWFLNSYPNAEDFGLLRFVGDTNASPELSPLVIFFLVVLTLLISLPTWFSARIVAGRYVNKVEEPNCVTASDRMHKARFRRPTPSP